VVKASYQSLMNIRDNSLGAFCADRSVFVPGADSGILEGLTFAAKDVFDIEGHRTGAGNPDWLRTHQPAKVTARAVQRLLDAGATLVGKTHTDELTYSLNGENYHYGTPVNPNAPGRIPGGSSSGSAVAVAAGLVDFALGTDTGGSVRLPASNCGIFGFRPTHGRIPNDHVVPLAPSFDTVGWFTRDADMLALIGQVFLPDETAHSSPVHLLLATDAFELVRREVRPALDSAIETVAGALGHPQDVRLYPGDVQEWMMRFRLLQGAEVWACHGEWIRQVRPEFGPEIRDRFEWAAAIDPADLPRAREVRAEVTQHLDDLLGRDGILCLPTSPDIALPLKSGGKELEQFRSAALALLCLAGLARLPQVSLPLASLGGCPLGVSLLGPRGSDARLLKVAKRLGLSNQ
jgi:amidase